MSAARSSFISAVFLILVCSAAANAKEWRGIVPLRSNKADVERIVGSANSYGQYEVENAKVTVLYSEGICPRKSEQLSENCECLVPKDTVLRIFLTFHNPPSVSTVGFDKARYRRTPFTANEPSATYSNFTEGVVYTVSESDNRVTNVDYLPSASDCQEVIRRQSRSAPNVWQGIVPWQSTRGDVETLLGQSTDRIGHVFIYRTATNRVDVAYSNDPCRIDYNRQSASTDLVLKIIVMPQQRMLIRDLGMSKDKYIRIPFDHPENWVQYLNREDGITVDAILMDGCEEVRSITYEVAARDKASRCRLTPNAEPTRP